MLLAVNIPEQEPAPGQLIDSSSSKVLSSILPRVFCPTASKTVIRSVFSPVLRVPASIGPPLANTAGMSSRAAAISIPGTILSQLGMQSRPSKGWAMAMDSTLSAISSREASEYFIPVCPMAIPSQMAMVLNSKGTPPASRIAS